MSSIVHSSEKHERIYEFLQENPVAVLATVDNAKQPHGSVIYFHVDDNFTVTFTTKHDTKKHENLKHSPKVMLVVFEAASQTVVQISGEAEALTDKADINDVFTHALAASMRTSMAGLPPISKLQAGNYSAYRVSPTEIRMAVFARPDSGGYELFETVDLAR